MFVASWCSASFVLFCVPYCTGHFNMVPLNLTCVHCLQHSFFEHLFILYLIKYVGNIMCEFRMQMYNHGIVNYTCSIHVSPLLLEVNLFLDSFRGLIDRTTCHRMSTSLGMCAKFTCIGKKCLQFLQMYAAHSPRN